MPSFRSRKRKGSLTNSRGQPLERDSGIHEEGHRVANLAIYASILGQDRRGNINLMLRNMRWTVQLWCYSHLSPEYYKIGRTWNSKSSRAKPRSAYRCHSQTRRQYWHYSREGSGPAKQTQRTVWQSLRPDTIPKVSGSNYSTSSRTSQQPQLAKRAPITTNTNSTKKYEGCWNYIKKSCIHTLLYIASSYQASYWIPSVLCSCHMSYT